MSEIVLVISWSVPLPLRFGLVGTEIPCTFLPLQQILFHLSLGLLDQILKKLVEQPNLSYRIAE